MANKIFPVGTDRDNLKLVAINENGTISEMIKTIDENFKNIAAHGGGPDGLPGKDGINGTDGTSAEYIFALCDDEPIAGENFPANDAGKANLFDGVEFSATGSVWFPSNSNKITEWHDHPQGVSKEHKNEYVFSRYRRSADESIWFYAEKPELWAHWGETGKDGDGVEYIFMRSKGEISSSNLENLIKTKSELDQYQSIIYQLDDFFPGKDWFTGKNAPKNKENARKAIIAKLGSLPSDFDSKWEGNYGMIAGNGSYNWTDDPKGTDPIYVYEYVAIRRCNVDDEDGKEWSDFSIPAVWSHYGLSTKTIIIYCNKEGTTPPVQPQRGQGTWNEETSTLVLPKVLTDAGWADTNIEPEDNEITWMCSGIFETTGANVFWSKPMRITGRDGKQGEDGTTIEFIYVLSENMPEHPDPTTNSGHTATEKLFDDIEASRSKPKFVDAYGNRWYDRAQPISQDNPTEWVWSRRREKESDPWEYDDTPIIWAHWGEDGTDGDGVEYIFTRTLEQVAPPAPAKYNTLNNDQKKIFQIDDFVPSAEWFSRPKSRTKAQKALDREITNTEWNNHFGFDVTTVMWYDNPKEVNALSPFQWVSIRRSTADEDTGGKRFWEDFSDPPVLWNSYGKSTRTFIVYCNVADGVVPPTLRTPVGGFWDVDTKKLVKDKNNLTIPYTYDALASGVTQEDRENHINVWEDDNEDVDGKIAWMSSATFGDDGNIIGEWSSPFRITGHNGEPGADGSNQQYIYARCDETPKYPKRTDFDTDVNYIDGLDRFFDDVDDTDNTGYWPNQQQEDSTKWTDNPQGIEDIDGHRTEWVWSRSLKAGKEDAPANWEYAPAPVKWARWGEDGTDGDGVEYIFYHGTSVDGHNPNKALSTDDQKAIYQMNDFYPGEEWFDKSGQKEKVETKLGKTFSDEEWTELRNYFKLGWTDNPSGVDFEYPFEWVSIRRTENDPEDASGKIWGPFSDPKPWANYNIDTRVFMVYCNVEGETTVPTKPDSNYGMWDKSVDGLIGGTWDGTNWTPADPDNFAAPVYNENNPGGNPISVWSDANVDDPTKIAWLCSGIYAENGRSISWSAPFRITGAEGKPGADGSNIEFVYCLSEEMPKYPPASNYNYRISFFENIENAKYKNVAEGEPNYLDPNIYDKENMHIENGIAYYIYNGTYWTDNPQGIEDVDGKRKEWVWSRSLPANATTGTQWTFPPTPVIWAHWGEDGTDGDGVEYVFILRTRRNAYPGTTNYISTWNGRWDLFLGDSATATAKAAYNMDDFVPNPDWFTANKTAVENAMNSESPNSFNDDHWRSMVETFTNYNLGDWEDNPLDLVPSNAYEFVSIRKSTDGKWGPFSYPKLWSKYNISTLKVFAFTSTTLHEDIRDYQPTGLTGDNIPSGCTYNGYSVDVTWSDGPQPTDTKPQVWMTSATITENDNGYALDGNWSSPSKMTDTAEFQVEWATNDIIGTELLGKITQLKGNPYNFGKFLTAIITIANDDPTDNPTNEEIENRAEAAWRYVVKNGYDPNDFDTDTPYLTSTSFNDPISAVGLDFADNSSNAILMATCQLSNGIWSNWKLVRVKGEKGEAGTSINIKDRIAHEEYLASGTSYTEQSAESKFNSVKNSLTLKTGELVIIYPDSPNSNGIYSGLSDGSLCMWKKTATGWTPYYNEQHITTGVQENIGDTYTSPNGHLILWDGDSWVDVGNIVGPAGPAGEILIKYANDSTVQGQTYVFVEDDDEIPTAKYIGFITYPEGNPPQDVVGNPDHPDWHWSLFKGQDGFGYEYIFKATLENNAPSIPTHITSWETTANVIPTDWVDEPIEPTSDYKYVWMCWRKLDHSNNKWTRFKGKGNTQYARLWQVYQKALNSVTELYHADSSSSPANTNHNAQRPTNPTELAAWNRYWVGYSSPNENDTFEKIINHDTAVTGMYVNPVGNDGTHATAPDPETNFTYNLWSTTNCHLFNRELISYSDGTYFASAPHYVATWEDGIIDIQEYYILESKNGTDGLDPGEKAPKTYLKDGTILTPITSETYPEDVAGKDYWTLGSSIPKMDEDWPVLWNINKKIYRGANGDEITKWTTPLVIGTYGEGTNGEDAIYVDLDNEMDSIQIDENNKVIVSGTYSTTVRLYQGETLLRIGDIDISGEEAIGGNNYTVEYYENATLKGSATFDSDGDRVSGTDILNGSTKLTHDINCIKITFTVNENDVLTSIHNKITISVAHIEKGSTLEIARRQTSYTFIGIVNSPVYSILTKESAIIESKDENDNKVLNPASFAVSVIKKNGPKTEPITSYSGASADFRLYVTYNSSNTSTWLSTITSGSFIVPSSIYGPTYLSAGDKLTFAINIDNVGQSGDFETTVDRETVYVLKQGVDGEPGTSGSDGAPGNGYQYKYIQYLNASKDWYGGINCTMSQASPTASPVFKIGTRDVTATSAVASYARGADADHTYEWRSERYGYGSDNASTWSMWSQPVTVAKYLDEGNISAAVATEISAQSETIASIARDSLGSTISDVESLMNKFDDNGFIKENVISGSTRAGIVNGYLKTSEFGSTLQANIGGVTITASGQTKTFSEWINYENGEIASVYTSLDAINGTLNNVVNKSELSNVTTAVQTLRADAHDRFAEINSTVANATFATDDEGYLLVDMPIYTTWHSSASADPDERRDVEWVLFKNATNTTSGTINSLVPLVKNEEDYYNGTDKTKRVFVLYKDIAYSSISSYIGNSDSATTFKSNLMSIRIKLKKLENDFEITLPDSVSDIHKYVGTSTPSTNNQVRLIIYTTVEIEDGAPVDDYLSFEMLDWTVGVGGIGSSVSPATLVYAKTGSVFEEPLLKSSNGYNDVFNNLYTYSSLYSSSGYILYKDENDTVKAVDTHDKVTITSSYPFKVIKETNGANTLTKEQLKNALTKGIYYDISDYVLTAGNEMTYTIDVSANSTYYIAFNYSGTKTISYNLSNYGCSRITFNDDYIIDQSIMYDIVIKPSKLTLGTEGMYDWGRSPITIKEDKTIYSGIDYSDFFQKSVTFIDLSVSQKDTAITLKMTTDTPSNTGNYRYLTLNHIFTERDINNIFNDANEVANNITFDGDVKVSPNYFTREYSQAPEQKGFLNNSNYGTENITIWNPWASSITINFNDGKSSNDGRYHITLVQYYWDGYSTSQLTSNFRNKIEITGYSVDTSSGSSKKFWEGANIINTTDGTATRTSTEMYYTLDKLTVIHQAAAPLVPSNIRRKARNTNAEIEPGVKAYIDVYDIDKPYLITSVTELATISQTVSDGIACTEIITGAGSNSAAAVFQATPDGSSINFLADTVGIESSHFKLNKTDGLWMDGDINVRSLTTNSGNTQITEDGTLYAKNAIIEGNITANNFLATTSYEKPDSIVTKTAVMNAEKFEVTSNTIDAHSGTTESAKIYITVLDELDLSDASLDQECVFIKNSGSIVTNIPTLCFDYRGKTYYLNPEMWWQYQPQQAVDNWLTTDIYYKFKNNIYTEISLVKNTLNATGRDYVDSGIPLPTGIGSGGNVTLYKYDPDNNYRTKIETTTGAKYVFGYSAGSLGSQDAENLQEYLTNNNFIDAVAVNVSPEYQYNVNRKQPISDGANGLSTSAIINNYNNLKFTSSNNLRLYEILDYDYWGALSGTRISDTSEFNSSIITYLRNTFFRSDNVSISNYWNYRDTSLLEENPSEPITFIANPFNTLNGGVTIINDNDHESYAEITVNGAYEQKYSAGHLSSSSSQTDINGFVECVYTFDMFLNNNGAAYGITTNNDTIAYLKQITINVTFGLYLTKIAQSNNYEQTILNALKSVNLNPTNIGKAVHIEAILEYWADGNNITIIGKI